MVSQIYSIELMTHFWGLCLHFSVITDEISLFFKSYNFQQLFYCFFILCSRGLFNIYLMRKTFSGPNVSWWTSQINPLKRYEATIVIEIKLVCTYICRWLQNSQSNVFKLKIFHYDIWCELLIIIKSTQFWFCFSKFPLILHTVYELLSGR